MLVFSSHYCAHSFLSHPLTSTFSVVVVVVVVDVVVLPIYIYIYIAFDNRTKSAREIWRQMQATRYRKANPDLKINTEVMGNAAAPEVVFKFIDETEVCFAKNCCGYMMALLSLTHLHISFLILQKRFDSQHYTASEILFDVHLSLDKLDNEFEMTGKTLDD
jgi:hypothetical protein